MPVSEAELARAAEILRAGGLVAFPTETVYGLGANALDVAAVERIYDAKGRPASSPLIVHVSSIEMARGITAAWPAAAQTLAEHFWPGPLTLVLEKNSKVPDRVTAGLGTVGVRMPAHPIAQELIRRAGVPLAAPSANRFTEISPTTAAHVRASLGNRVELILDGGPTEIGIESTVLSLAGGTARLLRPGAVSREEIEELVGRVEAMLEPPGSGAHAAPGLHARHYAPRTPLLLLAPGEPVPAGRGRVLTLPADPRAAAARLYADLRTADAEGWDWLAIERPPATPEWAAILDRLQRASNP